MKEARTGYPKRPPPLCAPLKTALTMSSFVVVVVIYVSIVNECIHRGFSPVSCTHGWYL